ncbi:hypothetical protein FHS77_002785 [Paenochrobactrum gallinarii]|uniref:Transposase n=1 Tax=Paenochrobactrum gallinarii TaxID=643673 RepID=A0A841LVL4_9HYPH|nr:hypothetical protein [Paenochrobactrum gallinarii]
MSDSVNHTRTFEILTAGPVGSRRRPRDWPDDVDALKAMVLAMACEQAAKEAQLKAVKQRLSGWRP